MTIIYQALAVGLALLGCSFLAASMLGSVLRKASDDEVDEAHVYAPRGGVPVYPFDPNEHRGDRK